MPQFHALTATAALLALFSASEAHAAGLYSTRCDALTGTAVGDPVARASAVRIVPRAGTPPKSDMRRREHVRISAGLADALGWTDDDVGVSGASPQIRVSLGGGSPVPTATFTVADIDLTDDALRLAVWLPEDLNPSTGGFKDSHNGYYKLFGARDPEQVFAAKPTATVHAAAPSATFVVDGGSVTRRVHFNEPNAAHNKQLRECVELRDDERLAVLAPHGGGIETKIADELATLLTDLDHRGIEPSVWEAAGQWGGTTFERWHVTATQISGDTFPGYGELEASGDYRYAVALHGFVRGEPAVVMGGRASRQAKCYLIAAIERWLRWKYRDERITYKVFAPDGEPVDVVRASTGPKDKPKPLAGVGELDGFSSANVVNRIAPNATGARGHGGIQLEISSGVRSDPELFHEFMRALAFALDGLIRLAPAGDFCAQYE